MLLPISVKGPGFMPSAAVTLELRTCTGGTCRAAAIHLLGISTFQGRKREHCASGRPCANFCAARSEAWRGAPHPHIASAGTQGWQNILEGHGREAEFWLHSTAGVGRLLRASSLILRFGRNSASPRVPARIMEGEIAKQAAQSAVSTD